MAATTTRRALLKAAPVLAIAPSAALASAEDLILPIYREWCEAHSAWRARADTHDWDGPEMKALQEAEYAAFDRITLMTPTSMAGIAAMAHLLWTFNATWAEGTEEREKGIGSLENLLLAGIWRAASGEAGHPTV